MHTPELVAELSQACVSSVERSLQVELDYSQETLPFVDHYARLESNPSEEIFSLLAPMVGAYFGEVVRKRAEAGVWEISDDHAEWRLHFPEINMSFNPIGVAAECILQKDVPGWGAHVQVQKRDEEVVRSALNIYGDVRLNDYYTLPIRYEAIEQAYSALQAIREPG
ncbi:MAG: hypothetical protein R3A47_00715 [Polyangiales bacterium]